MWGMSQHPAGQCPAGCPGGGRGASSLQTRCGKGLRDGGVWLHAGRRQQPATLPCLAAGQQAARTAYLCQSLKSILYGLSLNATSSC